MAKKTAELVPANNGHDATEEDIAPNVVIERDPNEKVVAPVLDEEPEQKPEVKKDEPADEPAEDDGFLAIAEEHGYTAEDVTELGRERIERHIAAEDRRLIQQARLRQQNQPKPNQTQDAVVADEEEIDLGLTEAELPQDVIDKINQWKDKTSKKSRELSDKLAAIEKEIVPIRRDRANEDFQKFDTFIQKLNPSLFGKGTPDKITPDEYRNRERLAVATHAWNKGRRDVGLPELPIEQAARRVYAAEFYKEAKQQTKKQVTQRVVKKVEEQASQIIGRPQSTGAPVDDMTPYEARVVRMGELIGKPVDLTAFRESRGGGPIEE